MTEALDFAAQLKVLSAAYAEQLPAQLEAVDQAWRQLPPGAWDEDGGLAMHRMVHGLSGSGKIFGFALLGEAARQLEAELLTLALARTAPGAAQHEHIGRLLRNLRFAAAADRLAVVRPISGDSLPPLDTP